MWQQQRVTKKTAGRQQQNGRSCETTDGYQIRSTVVQMYIVLHELSPATVVVHGLNIGYFLVLFGPHRQADLGKISLVLALRTEWGSCPTFSSVCRERSIYLSGISATRSTLFNFFPVVYYRHTFTSTNNVDDDWVDSLILRSCCDQIPERGRHRKHDLGRSKQKNPTPLDRIPLIIMWPEPGERGNSVNRECRRIRCPNETIHVTEVQINFVQRSIRTWSNVCRIINVCTPLT